MNDKDLILKIKSNPEFFGEIIDRYEQKILRYILRITDIPYEDSEELLQEIFIKVYKNINEFNDNLSLSSWIYRIAHNLVIDNYRKKEKEKNNISLLDEEYSHIINSLTDGKNPSDNLKNKDIKDILNKAILMLRIEYREIILLRYADDYSYDEISDILKLPIGTISTLINRAKKDLKENLNKLNFNF